MYSRVLGIVSVQFQRLWRAAPHILLHFFDQRTSLVFLLSFWSCFEKSLSTLLSLFSCLASIAASSTILYNSASLLALSLCSSWSKCLSFLSRLTPKHPSRQRSPSICLDVSNSSTCHVSFDRLPPRARIANGSWVWNANPFLTIRYASRSWHVSKPHPSFSLLTPVPFSQMKRKKIWIHDAPLLSEMVTWLSGIPEGIIHRKLLCHHHQQRADALVHTSTF